MSKGSTELAAVYAVTKLNPDGTERVVLCIGRERYIKELNTDIVNPDGTTIYFDASTGKLKARGGGAGGTTDYEALSNLPTIEGTVIKGPLTLADIGISEITDARIKEICI